MGLLSVRLVAGAIDLRSRVTTELSEEKLETKNQKEKVAEVWAALLLAPIYWCEI